MSPRRRTAEARRDDLVAAATVEFARGGFAGTSADAITTRAGVSQAYLFRLFGTKRDLFLAAVGACFAATRDRLAGVGRQARVEGCPPDTILERMGAAYVELARTDRDLLRLQIHAYSAAGDPEIATHVQAEFVGLWHALARVAGVGPGELQAWFAQAMLVNVVACITNVRTRDEFCAHLAGRGPG